MTFWIIFRRVTVPISIPTILDIMFVNALTTIAAVTFLYGPATKLASILASISVIHMDGSWP